MFRPGEVLDLPSRRFPRVRGDVPVILVKILWVGVFSPRARGCSRIDLLSRGVEQVFPACAGMFRIY